MDFTKLRPHHLVDRHVWRRGFYSVRELALSKHRPADLEPIEELDAPSGDARPPARRLRILFAAPRYDYGDPRRGLGIEETYFLNALVAMGHKAIRFDSLTLAKAHGKPQMNRLLVDTVARYDPDVLMTIMFKDEFEPSAIHLLTDRMGGRTVNWFCDDQWRFESYSRRWAPHFGWVVTTSQAALERYASAGINNVIKSQWGCNHFLYRPFGGPKRFDVSFIGQPHGDRPVVIESLRRAGINVSVWGFGWPAGKVSQSEMIAIFSGSKINLNLSNASTMDVDQIKGRDFEVPGCAGFLLTKGSVELRDYYDPGQEVESYESVDELIDKIRHYLAADSEREQIARRGYKRTLRDHTMETRLTEVFERVLEG